jgi:hypothetical protein
MEGQATPAGWYPDPRSPQNERYWDGQRWTDQVRKASTVIASQAGEVATGEAKSADERKAILASRVAYYVGSGYRPESQTEYQATLVRGHRPNHVLHLILSLVTVGLWLVVWFFVAISSGERRKVITVDEYGRALETDG